MPIRVFWNLQLSMRTKLSLCAMMSLTLLSAIVTCVKATYLWLFTGAADPRECSLLKPSPALGISSTRPALRHKVPALTLLHIHIVWDVVPLVIWGIVEQNVVIIAACVPPVRRVFSKGVGGRGTSGSGSNSKGSSKFSILSAGALFVRSGRAGHSKSATMQSSTGIPLADQKGNAYLEFDSRKDNASRSGIMRTVGVSVRSDDASSQEEILGDEFVVYTGSRGGKNFAAVGTQSTV